MQRFYFHLFNSIGYVPDEEGLEFPGLDSARQAAIANIRSLLQGDLEEGVIDLRGWIEIADQAGGVLAVIPFADAVELRLGTQPA
jgi:hypothetical protein